MEFSGCAAYSGQDTGDLHEKKPGTLILRANSSIAVRFLDDELNHTQVSTPWRLLLLTCGQEYLREIPDFETGIEDYFWGINKELIVARRCLRSIVATIYSITVPSVSTFNLDIL
jgi:hypothetical protein